MKAGAGKLFWDELPCMWDETDGQMNALLDQEYLLRRDRGERAITLHGIKKLNQVRPENHIPERQIPVFLHAPS